MPPKPSIDLYPPVTMPEHPSWSDIEAMALHYPQARTAVVMVERGDWTREEALIRLTFAFADAFQRGFAREVERLRFEMPRYIVVP